jgi:ParB/RepB/Spo0J family partition protein
MASSQAPITTPVATVSTVSLSRIVIEEGFNPRAEIDPVAQKKLEHSIEQRGILQPVLVDPREDGDYTLVDGHRRIQAAAQLGLMEIPISIRPSQEDGDNLVDAVVANQLHAHLNPLEEALACRRLFDTRLTRKEVAVKLEMTQATVKDRLEILELPEYVWPKVANGVIPLSAVKTLIKVAKVHPELVHSLVAAVLETEGNEEPYTWTEIAEQPLAIAVQSSQSLPAGVFQTATSYPLESFSLSEKATADLVAYTKLTGGAITAMRFTSELVEQARLLGAAHSFGWGLLIVGQDVGDRLAEDYIAHVLKQERARQRREHKTDTQPNAVESHGDASDGQPVREESAAEQEWRHQQEAKAERQAQQETRDRASAYNLDLGVLAFKHLVRLKVDEQVLRILAAVDLGGDLRGIAARGARLALPGWVTQTQQRNGKTKTTYIDPNEAEARASVFLQDAQSAGDIAGRSIALIALASLADEDAIARTRRSMHQLSFSGPWARQAERDLHAIVRDRIKEGQLPALDAILTKRLAAAEKAAREGEEARAARVRLENLGELTELDETTLDAALSDAELAWGKYDLKTHELRARVKAERARLATSAESDDDSHTSDADEEEVQDD